MAEQINSENASKTKYVEKGGKRLRCGFTTGSCAAAAAAAATQMLLTGEIVQEVEIRTPGGLVYRAQIMEQEIVQGSESASLSMEQEIARGSESASLSMGQKTVQEIAQRSECLAPARAGCAVRKDGGDDPDITTGTLIRAEVSRTAEPGIFIDGGKGIGRVTKSGLDQPVGEAAINHVPREMIEENVERVLRAWQNNRKGGGDSTEQEAASRKPASGGPEAASRKPDSFGLRIVISAPEGEALAQHTFNPRLGIVGGISILGTTGIVEPMSDRAVVETIRAQMKVLKAQGQRTVVMAPGNYGLSFLTQKYGMREDEVVLISNFAAEAVKIAAQIGFEGILLAGHIGKLVKIAGGSRNTHSMYGDRRMEILWEIAEGLCGMRSRNALQKEDRSTLQKEDRNALQKEDRNALQQEGRNELRQEGRNELRQEDGNALQKELADCVMTDAALEVLDRYGLKEQTAQEMARRICANLRDWSGGRLWAQTIVFSNKNCELVRSEGAAEMLRRMESRV